MKTWSFFLSLFICSNFSFANVLVIWKGDYIIQSQADADNFINACSCEVIEGNLMISGNDIEHLDSLYILKEVQGSVDIKNNPNLYEIKGFSGFITVKKTLNISDNNKLQFINSFDALTFIGQNLGILGNANLEEINAFDEINSISESVSIFNNQKLKTLTGFSSLEYIGDNLYINRNPALIKIPDFTNLKEVKGSITIDQSDALTEISGFEMLTNLGDFGVRANNSLISIKGFNKITTADAISISENKSLQKIDGFGNVERIGKYFGIYDNPELSRLNAFQQLEIVISKSRINLPSSLKNDTNFNSLKAFNGELLTNYNYFPQLEKVHLLYIQNVDKDTLGGFENLKDVGTLIIRYNDSLKVITAFPILENVNEITIENNAKLEKITGFNNLTSINENFNFIENRAVEKLDFFNQLRTIGNKLNIEGNPNLKDISGFENLDSVDVLTIQLNSELKTIDSFDGLSANEQININGNIRLGQVPNFKQTKRLHRLNIISNTSLQYIPDFNHIIDIQHTIISSNPNLEEIDGFGGIMEAKLIDISANNNLLKIKGFNKLKKIEGNIQSLFPNPGTPFLTNLHIENRNLRQLEAFENLIQVGHLELTNNIHLKSIDNFSSLIHLNGNFSVSGNLQLNECCLINCWIEQGVADPEGIWLSNNDDICSDLAIIKNNCKTNNCKEAPSLHNLSLALNPVLENLQFDFTSDKDQTIQYHIYNINDQQVAEGTVDAQQGCNTKTIPTTFSQKGHYFLLLFNNDVSEVIKFVKLN